MRARKLVAAALAIASCAALPSHAEDATYPTRVVRLVVPWPAGGVVDGGARILAGRLSEKLGKNFIVENHPGASGNLGSELVARSEPDGYTLLNGSAVNTSVYATFQNVSFDIRKDFIPLCHTLSVPLFVVVGTNSPFKSLAEIISEAKAHPGELTYGSAGIGSGAHFAGQMLEQMASIKLQHIPYKGNPPSEIDAMAGRISFAFDSNAAPQIMGGKLKGLAATTEERSSVFPEIETVAEQGYSGYAVDSWHGLWAPKGTPEAVVDKLIQAIQDIGLDESFRAKLRNIGADAKIFCGADFRKYIDLEMAKYKSLAERAGMQPIE
jgi:tripartite-type tricarboxylate transporter receptor subunit TctC